MKQRALTVSALARGSEEDRNPVPWLRLSGRWLEKAGFMPGAKYIVTVEPGRLVIEVIPTSDESRAEAPTPDVAP